MMDHSVKHWLIVIICLVIYGLLSGCALVGVDIAASFIQDVSEKPHPEPWHKGKNRYEPIVLASSKDMIRIKYLSVGPNAEHEQVKQLMFDHCHGAYIESSRVELRGYDTVEAECSHDTASLRRD